MAESFTIKTPSVSNKYMYNPDILRLTNSSAVPFSSKIYHPSHHVTNCTVY